MALDDLEQVAFASVAVTATALHETAGGEVTFLGWRALVVLGAAGHPLRTSELGGRLALSKPSVSRLVRRLERHGLIALAADPVDRRIQLVELSEKGSELRAAVVSRRRDLLAAALVEPVPTSFADGLAAIARRLGPWI